jgi:hypothetical protein
VEKSLEEITADREMALLEGFQFAHRLMYRAKNLPFPDGGAFADGTWKTLCEVADGLTDVLLENDTPEMKAQLAPRDRATAQSIHKAWGRIRGAAFKRQGLPEP